MFRDIDFSPVRPGGEYIDSRTMLPWMIAFAYDVKNYLQLRGLPKWAESQSFSVSAKPADGFPTLPPAENHERVRLMMRAMLEDRLHLRLHTEVRQGQVFTLEQAKGGIKIHEVDTPVPPAKEGPVGMTAGDRDGRMIGQKSTMAGLARALVIFLKTPVTDETGLKGYYDFDVSWKAAETPEAQSTPGIGSEGIGLILSALRDQLGLRLSRRNGPVKYWVVDHVEMPSEN